MGFVVFVGAPTHIIPRVYGNQTISGQGSARVLQPGLRSEIAGRILWPRIQQEWRQMMADGKMAIADAGKDGRYGAIYESRQQVKYEFK